MKGYYREIGIEDGRVVGEAEVNRHRQTGLGNGDAQGVENLLVDVSWLGGPLPFLEISENRRRSMGFHCTAGDN